MERPSARELAALRKITLGWEYREKLGGEKTFIALIEKGWIMLFQGHNPFSDKYSLTSKGDAARALGPAPTEPRQRRLAAAPSRLTNAPFRIGTGD